MSAEIIQFPVPERSCTACENGLTSPKGTYCMLFREVIHFEKAAAEDCEAYEPDGTEG